MSVPVLSEQITVVEPRVSTAFILRIMALCLAMFRMPKANVITRIIGNPSGTIATKIAIAVMNCVIATSRNGSDPPQARTSLIDTNKTATIRAMKPRNLPRDSSFSSNGVFGVFASEISLAIRPNWVFIPVSTTRPTARPEDTVVPMYIMFRLSARSALTSIGSTCFVIGSDSPVKADSSTLH